MSSRARDLEKSIVYNSPLGPLLLTADDVAVTRLTFLFDKDGDKPLEEDALVDTDCKHSKSAPLQACVRWLDAYFKSEGEKFDVPRPKIRFKKLSPFFKKVWGALIDTKLGETVTYGELAKRAGNPRAARAVGQAVRSHQLAIIVPCHRVVHTGAKKGVGNYSGGCGPKTKEWLLEHETKKKSS